MGRYQGPMPVGSSPTNVRTSGGHVTHNPPHLNDNEMIDQSVVATMEQQISEMDQQLQGIGGVYGFGQLYPTYPYGYSSSVENAQVVSFKNMFFFVKRSFESITIFNILFMTPITTTSSLITTK